MLPAENADPEKLLMQAQTTEVIFNLLDSLTPREKEILSLRNGIDCQAHTYIEIGKMYGVTPARIQQLEAKALRKMRHPSRFHHLRTVLPQLDMIKEQVTPI
jgi:RNA polymerase primary sigma factor